jgi:YebC/PmpR family DNA-binding regulatory protein
MAGHNKWSQIKHKKAATDAKRSRIFGKYAKLIALESKRASGDVNDPGLRAVIDRARSVDMPKDNIERAIARGTSGSGEELFRITYETYGPGGVGILIDTVTDNKNRTSQELRHLLSEMGYALAEPGSASWAFKKTGTSWDVVTSIPFPQQEEAALMLLLEKLDDHDDVEEVYTNAAE